MKKMTKKAMKPETQVPPSHYYPLEDETLRKYSLDIKKYQRSKIILIERNTDKYGGLLNMNCNFPMTVNGIMFKSVEHLYQCCRFPNLPDLQKRILEKSSPLVAKWITKPHKAEGRPNWYQLKIHVMRWCLRVKLANNYDSFGKLLDSTGKHIIVETSPDGDFWGAIPQVRKAKTGPLFGCNIFGELLMELREEYRTKPKSEMLVVQPLQIPDFILFGKPIEVVDCR